MQDRIKSIFILAFWTVIAVLAIVPGRGGAASADPGHYNPTCDRFPARSEPNGPSRHTGPLTLARAKQIALENSPTLAAALERIHQAREAVVQAGADRLPTLTATAGWDYTAETANSSPGTDETLYNGKISATQVLFDGFYRKYAILAAEYGAERSRAAQDETKNLLAWSVAQAYLNVQLARETIRIAESDMDFNKAQEIEAAAKERSGTGSYSDVLNFKTRVNSARSSLLDARQDFSEAVHGLAALVGYEDARLPAGVDIAPLVSGEADLIPAFGDLASLDENMEELLSRRPDLKGTSLAVQQADAGVRMARADFYPTVSLAGGYGTNAANRLDDEDRMGASLGVYVSFDLFSGGARKSRVREALSAKEELEKDLANARITAVSDIRSSAENIDTAIRKLALLQENAGLVQTTRDLVEKEYNAGQVSLVRLNEAQNDLVGAMGDLAKARVSLVLALEAFGYYTGENIN